MKRLEGNSSIWERIGAFKLADGASGNGGDLDGTDLRRKFGRLNLRRDDCIFEVGRYLFVTFNRGTDALLPTDRH